MGRRRVEVVVALLDVFAVIAFGAGETEEALFQDGIFSVPESDGKAEPAFAVGQPEQPVFSPAVRAAARLFMRKVAPAFSARGLILADGAPLALGEIGAPAFPVGFPGAILGQPCQLAHGRVLTFSGRRGFRKERKKIPAIEG
jgi:hypothetical protein